jgi:hypothetical protein
MLGSLACSLSLSLFLGFSSYSNFCPGDYKFWGSLAFPQIWLSSRMTDFKEVLYLSIVYYKEYKNNPMKRDIM